MVSIIITVSNKMEELFLYIHFREYVTFRFEINFKQISSIRDIYQIWDITVYFIFHWKSQESLSSVSVLNLIFKFTSIFRYKF